MSVGGNARWQNSLDDVYETRAAPPSGVPTMGTVLLSPKPKMTPRGSRKKQNGAPPSPKKPISEEAAQGPPKRKYDTIDSFSILLINDALIQETGFYYKTEDGPVETLWEEGEEARSWGVFFRTPIIINFLSFLSFLDLLFGFVKPPTMHSSWMSAAANYLELLIILIYMVTVSIRFRYMWKAKDRWWDGAAEPRWIVVQFLVVFFLKTSTWIVTQSNPPPPAHNASRCVPAQT
jgi:hypothetical protein